MNKNSIFQLKEVVTNMVRIEKEDISYKELMVIDADGDKHTCDCLGISDDGELLFIKENEAHVGNAYYLEREFFVIDTEEYLKCLGIAAKNLRLQKSISKGVTELAVSYQGMYFGAGSSVQYIIHNKECSIFTMDLSIAERLDFNRIDKFEYEKAIRINECDVIRITHKDVESEDVYVQKEFNPSEFEKWLDMLR